MPGNEAGLADALIPQEDDLRPFRRRGREIC
jgi:hypothetical protein